MRRTVHKPRVLRGTIAPPGDKSISHRAALFNAISDGRACITNFAPGDACASTLGVIQALGIDIEREPSPDGGAPAVIVDGGGMDGLRAPQRVLDAGNSGTSMRLTAGLLAGRPFRAVLTGDSYLRSRPMARIIEPLRLMGARVSSENDAFTAPLVFSGGDLRGMEYELPVASAQVKSALLLAGLRAGGRTVLRQPAASRDHTERMLQAMGAAVAVDGLTVSVEPGSLAAADVQVPGDLSSAAFWLVAAAVHPDAEVRIPGVGVNPTRAGVLTILGEMGAEIVRENEREVAGEPVADLIVRSSELRGVTISGDMIPVVQDEIPVLAVAAALASGETRIRDAAELRHKESDRISATADWLSEAGVDSREHDDGITIRGAGRIGGGAFDNRGDHRMAMAFGTAGLVADSPVTIDNSEVADISYPGFWQDIELLSGEREGSPQ